MLDMMGRPYVMDFVENFYLQEVKRQVAVEYIAECARLCVINTAGGEERYTLDRSLKDILNPPKADDRTADEVISNIKQKLAELGA